MGCCCGVIWIMGIMEDYGGLWRIMEDNGDYMDYEDYEDYMDYGGFCRLSVP
jgi:hypothetical protein